MNMEQFIAGMPKAELHLHIEGVLEPDLKFDFARRNGLSIPYKTVEDVAAAYDFDDLSSFLVARYEGDRALVTQQDFYDLAMEYYRRGHRENLVYAEIFFDPQAHTSRGVPFEAFMEGLQQARLEAKDTLGIDSELILCFLRDMSEESAAEALEQAKPYKDWIIGVGLDSDEHKNPPAKFKRVFADAADQGYRLTMHCDVDQENSVAHIWQAIDDIGVERIDHGINSLEDPGLVEEIVGRAIGLTVCPVSNTFVVQDSRSIDLKRMLDLGMLASVGSDDPAYFGAYMNDNLATAQRDGDLTAGEVAQLMRNAFAASWAADDKKTDYIDQLDRYVIAADQ